MRVLGVDPGIHGGLAVIAVEDGAAPLLVEAIDVPISGVNAKERVDAIAIREWVSTHDVQHAFIERAQAMPRQGSSSGFKYGRAVGAIEAAIALSGIPVTIVEPSVWKRFHKLPGKEKEASRQRALEIFPASHALLARRLDHGRAEASLIALYGAEAGRAAPRHRRDEPEVNENASRQALISIDQDWTEATRALIERKAYGGGAA